MKWENVELEKPWNGIPTYHEKMKVEGGYLHRTSWEVPFDRGNGLEYGFGNMSYAMCFVPDSEVTALTGELSEC